MRSFPNTRLGGLLFFGVQRELVRRVIDPRGLKFLPTVGKRADFYHYTDAVFYLPSLERWLVTVDLFNLDTRDCRVLKERWDPDSESNFQSRLFQYKKGITEAARIERGGWNRVFVPKEFSVAESRPENHFILTPYYTEFREKRRLFCRLVADYFAKAAKEAAANKILARLSR